MHCTHTGLACALLGIEEKLSHRKLVLPGFVAVLSGGVEDESGWSAEVGPKEASGLPAYLKNQWSAQLVR